MLEYDSYICLRPTAFTPWQLIVNRNLKQTIYPVVLWFCVGISAKNCADIVKPKIQK